jgi:hypothetical protein
MKRSEGLKFRVADRFKGPRYRSPFFFDPLTGDRIGIGFSTYVLTYVAST